MHAAREEPPRSSLLVLSKVGVFTFPLPERGEVTIGRAADCHVRIDDPKASRYHARLRMAAPCKVIDQGSANGTFLGGQRLEAGVAVDFAAGEPLTIGTTVLVLQCAEAAAPLRVWSQEAFDARVAEERARGLGHAVLQIVLDPGAVASTAATTRAQVMKEVTRAEALDGALREILHKNDVIGSFVPGLYRILLVQVTAAQAKEKAAALDRALRARGFDANVELEGTASAPELPARASEAPAPVPDPPRASLGVLDAAAIDRIAASTINVLIVGETGVGKELMARRLHERSPRAGASLLCLNCAALSESLLESELFGFERGAFTGATQSKPGLLETAHGGTVFLDEVGEMPLALQAKLLRVLEQREVLRVGALKARPIDVRLISATNRDLEAEIAAGRFRRDVYFRLDGITVHVPPLRERVDEIEPLARAFVAEACTKSRRRVPDVAPAALALLERHAWPGNVRELRNVMERAVVLSEGDVIGVEHLPAEQMARAVDPGRVPSGSKVEALAAQYGADPQAEYARILDALTECGGNQTRAAEKLGISRRTLVTKLGRYDLPRPRKKA